MNVKDYEYTLLAQRKERSEPNRTGAGSIPARRINGKERKRNTMTKEKKQDGGWQFPKALEIVKCKEGNKEFMKNAQRGDLSEIRFYLRVSAGRRRNTGT